METDNIPGGNEAGLIVLSGIVFMFFMAMVLLLFFYFSKKKVMKKELEKQNLKFEHQKQLLQASIEIQEDERRRIARELHDDISSKLNIISLNSHLLAERELPEEDLIEIAENNVSLIAIALDSSRQIAHDLLPPVLDKFGLNAALESLCHEIKSTRLVTVDYSNNVTFSYAEKNKHLHVFRIVQELISNSLRHGKATAVSVAFNEKEGRIHCTYSDNGCGFSMEDMKAKKGMGMKNIESRVVFLEGTMAINSAPGKGFTTMFSF